SAASGLLELASMPLSGSNSAIPSNARHDAKAAVPGESLGLARRFLRPRPPLSRLAMLWPLLCLAWGAQAVTVNDLYETSQPVQGSREAAFVEALKTVLVKVSGQRAAGA